MNTEYYTPKGTRKNISLRQLQEEFDAFSHYNPYFQKAILFEQEDNIIIAIVPTTLAKIFAIVTFPLLAQAHYLTGSFKQYWWEFHGLFDPLKKGGFVPYFMSKNSDDYQQLKDIVE